MDDQRPPSDDEPADRTRGSGGGPLHLVVAWLLIAGVVSVLALAAEDQRREQRSGRSLRVAPTLQDDQLLAAKMAVGWHHLGFDQVVDESMRLDVRGDDAQALSGLRGAIALGELDGPAAARERLGEVDLAGVEGAATDAAVLYQLYLDGVDALSEAHRLRLRTRHGWFGRLALVHGRAADDAERAALLDRAALVAVGMSLVTLLMLGLLLGGVVLAVVTVVGLCLGRVAAGYRRDPRAGPVWASAFAIYLVGFVLFSLAVELLARAMPGVLGTWVHWFFPLALAPVLVVWLARFGQPWRAVLRDTGLHRGRGVLREMGAGLVGYVAGVPILVLGFWLTGLFGESAEDLSHPVIDEIAGGGAGAVFSAFLVAALFAPLVEETAFRGLLYHHLRRWYGVGVAALLQGVLFALVHPQGLAAVPVLAALAIVFALIREWRGSLIGCMTAHAAHNTATMLVLVLLLR